MFSPFSLKSAFLAKLRLFIVGKLCLSVSSEYPAKIVILGAVSLKSALSAGLAFIVIKTVFSCQLQVSSQNRYFNCLFTQSSTFSVVWSKTAFLSQLEVSSQVARTFDVVRPKLCFCVD